MESLFQIGLIVAESALGLLAGCLQTPEADESADAELLAGVQWLLCRPEESAAVSLLAQADAVIVGGYIQSEKDAVVVSDLLQVIGRVEQKVLAVALWGPQAHAMAAKVIWPDVLLPGPSESDSPPASALRARVCEAVRRIQSARSGEQKTHLSGDAAFPHSVLQSTGTDTPARRNFTSRQVRDLSHLRRRGGAGLNPATSPVRAEERPEEIILRTASPINDLDREAQSASKPDPRFAGGGAGFQESEPEIEVSNVMTGRWTDPEFAAENHPLTDRLVEAESSGRGVEEQAGQLMHLEARLRASRQEVESLSQQLQLADERARFAESKAEDFFQRLARERRRATDLSRQLAEAGENIARLNGLIEGRDASVTQLKQAGFERVRDVLIGERDRALKERDDARIQISRLDASLKAVKRDFLSSRTRLRQQLRELEELRDDLIRERDCAVSERDAVLIRVAELETPAPQPGEIDAASEPERDSLLAEIEQERGLSGDLKKENHALSAENHHLLHDLQSATARLMELEVSLSAAAKAAELTKAQLKSDSSQTLSPADQALPEITAEDEIPDPGTMAQTDLLLIRRVDSVVSRLLSTQANE